MKKLLFTAICAMAFTNGFAQQTNSDSEKDTFCGALALQDARGSNFDEILSDMRTIYDECMSTPSLPELVIEVKGPKPNTISK